MRHCISNREVRKFPDVHPLFKIALLLRRGSRTKEGTRSFAREQHKDLEAVMKTLLFLAMIGVLIRVLCNVQACTYDEFQALVDVSDANCSADCKAYWCTCCNRSLTIGNSDSDYVCCKAEYEILQCKDYPDHHNLETCSDLPDINEGGGPTGCLTGGSPTSTGWYTGGSPPSASPTAGSPTVGSTTARSPTASPTGTFPTGESSTDGTPTDGTPTSGASATTVAWYANAMTVLVVNQVII